MTLSDTCDELRAENTRLRARLVELEETLDAIRSGGVDALLVNGEQGAPQVYTLQGAGQRWPVPAPSQGEAALILTNQEEVVFYANQRLAELLDAPLDRVVGGPFARWLAMEERDGFLALLRGTDGATRRYRDLTLCREDGRRLPCAVAIRLLPIDNASQHVSLIVSDLTGRSASDADLRDNEQALEVLTAALPVGVCVLDANGKLVGANPIVRRIWGGAEFLSGQLLGALRGWRPGARDPLRSDEWAWVRAIARGQTILAEEIDIETRDGSRRTILNSALPIRGMDGAVIGAVVVNQDITDRRAIAARIARSAFHDPVTGLPNRRRLLDRLQQRLAERGRLGALLYIGLDHAKLLNDARGQAIGEPLQQQVAGRLTSLAGVGDMVAHLGEDEFALLLTDLGDRPDAALARARHDSARVLDALQAEYTLGGRPFSLMPGIGVTLFGDALATPSELLRRADLALTRAKTDGGNAVRFHAPDTPARGGPEEPADQ